MISILHQLEEVKTAPLSGEVLTAELWRKREYYNFNINFLKNIITFH